MKLDITRIFRYLAGIMETQKDTFYRFIVPGVILLGALVTSGAIVFVGSKNIGKDNPSQETLSESETNTESENNIETLQDSKPTTVGTLATFTEYEGETCLEDGKPLILLFSSTGCPHCVWIKDTFDNWAKKNSDKAAIYHWEFDLNDNTLTKIDEARIPSNYTDIYNKFNPDGTVPTYIFGCRFVRVGNRYETEDDLSKEEASFEAVLDELLKK